MHSWDYLRELIKTTYDSLFPQLITYMKKIDSFFIEITYSSAGLFLNIKFYLLCWMPFVFISVNLIFLQLSGRNG
jgi:hypothetical protein